MAVEIILREANHQIILHRQLAMVTMGEEQLELQGTGRYLVLYQGYEADRATTHVHTHIHTPGDMVEVVDHLGVEVFTSKVLEQCIMTKRDQKGAV